jgi:hypothetical protein
MEGSKNTRVIVSTVGNKDVEIVVSDTLTGYQLKEYINKNVCQSLGAL